MSSLDGQNLFGSGPHSFQEGAWDRALLRRGFAGVHGELVLDLGLRSRAIEQNGRLQAVCADDLRTLITQIEGFIDGQEHQLVGNFGQTYLRVVLEQFKPTTPIRLGRGYWCEYTIHYRQLP